MSLYILKNKAKDDGKKININKIIDNIKNTNKLNSETIKSNNENFQELDECNENFQELDDEDINRQHFFKKVLSKKKRTTITKEQKNKLELFFLKKQFMSRNDLFTNELKLFAQDIQLTEHVIFTWFKNKRFNLTRNTDAKPLKRKGGYCKNLFTDEQKKILNDKLFSLQDKNVVEKLAKELNLTIQQIVVYYQNKIQEERRKNKTVINLIDKHKKIDTYF